jgi:hypothetical protein
MLDMGLHAVFDDYEFAKVATTEKVNCVDAHTVPQIAEWGNNMIADLRRIPLLM